VLRWDEPDQLRQGIEDNLATLGVSRLAAVNLRVMDPFVSGQRFDAQLAALIQAREEGLIDGVGLSNITRPQLLRAAGQTEIVCVQNLFNLAYQRSPDVLTECTNRKIAFVPFSPLGWPGDARRDLPASRCSPRWGHGCTRHPGRSRSPGCSTSRRTSC
jgi:aryl-alcohol dehydrogenase-like predicted oxidoreductase